MLRELGRDVSETRVALAPTDERESTTSGR
jgi:hypothetical protein